MKRALIPTLFASLLLLAPSRALAWHDMGHMLVAQIAYLRLTPAAKARVDKLLVPQQGRRPWIHLCAGYYTAQTCEKIYDPVTIAVWMDDFRGDSLNDRYDTWHYTNYRPFFDGIPERTNVGPEPVNVLSQLNWCIDTLRKGTGRDKTDAETLGFLYHLVGDVHQPLHAATRYSAAHPDGDSGGNGFSITYPADPRVRNLHFFWDAGAGRFGTSDLKRPLDEAARTRLRTVAEELMRAYPADAGAKETEPLAWVRESNTIARTFAYVKVRDGGTPSPEYVAEAQKIVGQRITLAGYRMAEVLNTLFVN
jgi:S1/P1 Nuclease